MANETMVTLRSTPVLFACFDRGDQMWIESVSKNGTITYSNTARTWSSIVDLMNDLHEADEQDLINERVDIIKLFGV